MPAGRVGKSISLVKVRITKYTTQIVIMYYTTQIRIKSYGFYNDVTFSEISFPPPTGCVDKSILLVTSALRTTSLKSILCTIQL